MHTNDKNDLVTIVTATYNAEDLLEETILSVINQTYKNIEYIIIDGASTDKTIDIIKKYADKIDYWISEPDDGIYFAMNKAIEKATGMWINFMNAGDTFADDETVTYVMSHKNNKADLIYGNFQIKEHGIVKKAWDKAEWHLHMPFCHQTLFTRTNLMKEKLFDTSYRLAADHNFILKMYKEQKIFDCIDRTLAIFTLGGFAESNEFLMNIESLKILLDHKIPLKEIKQSDWYRELNRDICSSDENHISTLKKVIQEKEKFLRIQEEQISHLSALQKAIKQITNYSIWKHPILKYKGYKQMLLSYHRMKNTRKGNEVGNK